MIERAANSDIPDLVALMDLFYAESNCTLDRTWAAESFELLLGDEQRGGAWIARSGNAPAGYIVLALRHSMELGGLTGVIDDLFVRAEDRRLGVGSALVNALLETCRTLGARGITVEVAADSPAAGGLYRRFGFIPDGHGRQVLGVRLD